MAMRYIFYDKMTIPQNPKYQIWEDRIASFKRERDNALHDKLVKSSSRSYFSTAGSEYVRVMYTYFNSHIIDDLYMC